MAGTKIKHVQALRKSPTKKYKYPAVHMEIAVQEANKNGLIYFNHLSHEQIWMTEMKIEKLGVELFKWALDDPEAIKLSKFFHSKGITRKVVLEWCEKWPRFAEDFQFAKEGIGLKLWKGALYVDSGIMEGPALWLLPCYDREFREETERMAKLRDGAKQDKANKTIIVEMVDYSGKPIPETKK